jgi:hypothetical protein
VARLRYRSNNMKKPIKIKLIPLDMSKTDVTPDNGRCSHPDIKVGQKHEYLCLIDGKFYAGSFSRVWFGLNFDGWGGFSGLQYDAPGTNSSGWQQIWEIRKQ